MSAFGIFRSVLVFFLLVAAHFSLRPLIGGPAPVDFLCLAVLFASVRLRPGFAAVVGFISGLCLDALGLQGLGSAALTFTLVAYGASWLKSVFFADNIALSALFIFLGKWAFDTVFVLLTGGVPDGPVFVQLLLWSPLSAALTSLVGVVLLSIARPLIGADRRTSRLAR